MKIKITHLTKKYSSKTVLHNVDLEISAGMFGLLGPNGAGKTTLMRILTTLVPKTGGQVTLNGVDINDKRAIREMVGYLPQDFSLYPNLSVYEAMDYLALLSGLKGKKERRVKILELLEKVNLHSHMKVKVKALSGGMKRRLGIAQALLHDPKILIVDEPTAGLDPEERIRFRALLSDFARDRIVILSTHIVEDIEFSCENLAIMKEGSILYQGKTSDLIHQAEGNVWELTIPKGELDQVRKKYSVISAVTSGDGMRVRILSSHRPVEDAKSIHPTIEDAYMKLVKGV